MSKRSQMLISVMDALEFYYPPVGWGLSNKLCIWSVVRVICEVLFRIPGGAELSKCEKPDDRLI